MEEYPEEIEKQQEPVGAQKPPVKAGWICLAAAWALFLIPVPGLGMIGWALNLAAFIISIINMVKGRVGAGVAQLVCVLVVSPLVYFVGLGILWSHMMAQPEHYHRILL
ncbi:MAG: hypothetical protein M0Z75_09665 [Nitrospiraceae bacterium]|nr:hypothetical protein [Nitrospiraceae bacterium]